MVGATLGAGVGRYQGIHGLIIDALLSATLVTAQGKIVTISATENPDLFWAFRGAGQNFGVVLQATYRIFDATNGGKAMSADFIFAPQANASFFQALASYQGRLPAEMSAIVLIAWNEQLGAVSCLELLGELLPSVLIDVIIDCTHAQYCLRRSACQRNGTDRAVCRSAADCPAS